MPDVLTLQRKVLFISLKFIKMDLPDTQMKPVAFSMLKIILKPPPSGLASFSKEEIKLVVTASIPSLDWSVIAYNPTTAVLSLVCNSQSASSVNIISLKKFYVR